MDKYVDRADLYDDYVNKYKKSIQLEYEIMDIKKKKDNTKNILYSSLIISASYALGYMLLEVFNCKPLATIMSMICGSSIICSIYSAVKYSVLNNIEKNDERQLKLIYSSLDN